MALWEASGWHYSPAPAYYSLVHHFVLVPLNIRTSDYRARRHNHSLRHPPKQSRYVQNLPIHFQKWARRGATAYAINASNRI